MRYVAFIFLAGLLLASCEKIIIPDKFFNISILDLKGQKISEVNSEMQIKIVSEQLIELNKQVDLTQQGAIIFDKTESRILEAKENYVITAVPVLGYFETRSISLQMRVASQHVLLCQFCLFYRPTVRGTIIAGFSGGSSDGTFTNPAEMTLDAAGNIYVIDQRIDHDVVLKVTPAGAVSSFAGGAGEFGRLVGIGINVTLNRMYLSDATAQKVFSLDMLAPATVTTLAGSGTAGNADGTGTAASFRFGNDAVDDFGSSETGQGLSLDAAGNIYVGENYNSIVFSSQIRKITPAGVVTTVPGSRIEPTTQEEAAMPSGLVAITGTDLYYVSGSSGFFQGITRVNAGARTRLAGKVSFEGLNDATGSAAQFSFPKAIAAFASALYVADGTNGALRRVSSSGAVITLAGVGHFETNRFHGGAFLPPLEGSYRLPNPIIISPPDYFEINAAAIRMDQAGGVAVRNQGLIYVSDYGYKCIWKITIG